MDDVFISYANQDRQRAGELAAVLEGNGWTVWWDREIPPGRTFDEVIEKALSTARCVIVLWSAHSVASRWVRAEASAAGERGILVPALLEQVAIPLEFRRIQAADLVDWRGDSDDPELQKVLQTVAALVNLPPGSRTQPPPQVRTQRHGMSRFLRFAAVAVAGVLVGVALMYGLRPAEEDRARTSTRAEPERSSEAVGGSSTAAVAGGEAASPAADTRLDLLAAKNGGHLMRAPHENWIQPIDGSENWEYINGNEAVYAFKGNQPATFDTFRMLITETRGWNIRQFELLAANDAADGPFRSLGTFETQNVRLFPSPWQDFTFASTRARYFKVRVVSLFQPPGATMVEQWQLLGSF